MKIALLGHGRMGQAVTRTAQSRGHTICAVFELDRPLTDAADLKNADVLIDFSAATAVPAHMRFAARENIPLVEGTTGWTLDQINPDDCPGLTLVYSPNFSPGVYIFHRIVELAGCLAGQNNHYDAYVHEWHHTGKADSPSGTAMLLAQTLLGAMPDKEQVLIDSAQGKIHKGALHVTSTRAGRIPGTHEIGFDSEFDQIVLRHISFGREGFALGAIMAAEWVLGRTGIFSMKEFMQDNYSL